MVFLISPDSFRMTCFIVGLTGGIGSGKTTVSNAFKALGVTIIDADEISHQLTRKNHPTLKLISEAFGTEYVRDGQLDRNKMRKLVFSNPAKKMLLESILHPLIKGEMDNRAKECIDPYCIFSIPLLIEGGTPRARVDRILVIDAEEELRRQWIKKRSGLTDYDIDAIFASQISQEQRLAVADDILINDSTVDLLTSKVKQLHSKYLQLARKIKQ
jgi:dephospho-CoA kinase